MFTERYRIEGELYQQVLLEAAGKSNGARSSARVRSRSAGTVRSSIGRMVMRIGAWMMALGANWQAQYNTVLSDGMQGMSIRVSVKGDPC